MTGIQSYFFPNKGQVSILVPGAADGDYLIWVDDVLLGRATGAALRECFVTSPISPLHTPTFVRLRNLSDGQKTETGIWTQLYPGSTRIQAWSRGKSASVKRAVFVATDQDYIETRASTVRASIEREFGAYFEAYAALLIARNDAPDDFFPRLPVELQTRLVVVGLSDHERAAYISDALRTSEPMICIPLDAEAALLLAKIPNTAILQGPWLPADLPAPERGMRFSRSADAATMTFAVAETRLDLTFPSDHPVPTTAAKLLDMWFATGVPLELKREQQQALIERLAEIGAPVTFLSTPGFRSADLVRTLTDAQVAVIESFGNRGHRHGLKLTGFSWEALVNRVLAYTGADPDIDDLLSSECEARNIKYFSAYRRSPIVGRPVLGEVQ